MSNTRHRRPRKQADHVGNEAFTYDTGHYLVVSIDLPVSGRVTAASKSKPFLEMSLDLDVKQIPSLRTSGKIQRATTPDRGVFLSILHDVSS